MIPYLIGFSIGCIIQTIVGLIIEHHRCSYGNLDIDTMSSDEKDHYNVYLGNIDLLPKKKYVKLQIKIN